ncbi:hypothetical protein [Shewanella mangrovisoli]|uniref:hypothetical protein n=1 Tax=Shewanella mangrovisoli TaxID=2864211 RepID=UPI0035BAD22C
MSYMKRDEAFNIWIPLVGIIGVSIAFLIIIIYAIKFGCFDWSSEKSFKILTCDISNSLDNWDTFSALLSGTFSFVAAIGTISILLLSLKQFKVQQSQIDFQNKKQEKIDNERKLWDIKQLEFIEKQTNLLNLQIKKIEIEEFLQTLESIEKSCIDYKFTDKYNTYEKHFKDDTRKFNIAKELLAAINSFNDKKAYTLSDICYFFKGIKEILSIEYVSTPRIGDISNYRTILGFNIHTPQASINTLNSLINSISTRFKLELNPPEINSSIKLPILEIVKAIDRNHLYQGIKIESDLKGYIHLVLFIFTMTNSSLGPPYRNLLTIEHLMYGLDEFYNSTFTSDFIKRAKEHIETYCQDPELKSNLNMHLNNFEREYYS